MIEIIYKAESETNTEDTTIKLPKNIRQIGEGNSDYQIYVEDNIMNYLKKTPEKESDIRYGVLLGSVKKSYGYTYIFINGAVDVEDIVENTVIFSDEIWTDINDNIHRYFSDLKVVGWFTSLNYSVNNDMPYLTRIHLDNFAGNDKLYLKLDRVEDEENFYVYGANGLKKQSGYHIYYEKNNNMEDYIYGSNITSRFKPDVTKKKQQMLEENKVSKPKYGIEENEPKKNTVNFDSLARKLSKNIASVLMLLLLAGTIALVSNNQAMKDLKDKVQSLISGNKGSQNDIPVNGIINETEDTSTALESSSGDGGADDSTINTENSSEITMDNPETTNNSNEAATGGVTVIEKVTTENNESTTKETETTVASEEPTASVITNEVNYYVVNAGDTLYSIAMKIYNDASKVEQIMNVNNIDTADHIEAGDKLLLP